MAVAMRKAEHGLDATDDYRAAILAYRAAAERHSAPLAALSNLGVSLYTASALEGTSPRDMLEGAIEVFEQARDVDPENMVPHYYLGLCHRRLAQDGKRASVQLDIPLAEAAVADFERAIELAPERFQPWVGLGEVLHLRALATHDRGEDPGPFFARARQAFERALEFEPEQPTALLNLAWTVYFEGKFTLRAGRNPGSLLEEAGELCRQSLDLRRRPVALLCLGSVRRLQAEYLVQVGAMDRVGLRLAEARELFEEILTIDPGHAEAHRSLGRLFTLEAEWLRARRESPAPALERARRFLDEALELEGEVADFWFADVRWHLERIAGEGGMEEERVESLAAIRRSLDRAAELAPGSVEVARLEDRVVVVNPAR
jgi:tetratricopeptide (TPR) repeat protein